MVLLGKPRFFHLKEATPEAYKEAAAKYVESLQARFQQQSGEINGNTNNSDLELASVASRPTTFGHLALAEGSVPEGNTTEYADNFISEREMDPRSGTALEQNVNSASSAPEQKNQSKSEDLENELNAYIAEEEMETESEAAIGEKEVESAKENPIQNQDMVPQTTRTPQEHEQFLKEIRFSIYN